MFPLSFRVANMMGVLQQQGRGQMGFDEIKAAGRMKQLCSETVALHGRSQFVPECRTNGFFWLTKGK